MRNVVAEERRALAQRVTTRVRVPDVRACPAHRKTVFRPTRPGVAFLPLLLTPPAPSTTPALLRESLHPIGARYSPAITFESSARLLAVPRPTRPTRRLRRRAAPVGRNRTQHTPNNLTWRTPDVRLFTQFHEPYGVFPGRMHENRPPNGCSASPTRQKGGKNARPTRAPPSAAAPCTLRASSDWERDGFFVLRSWSRDIDEVKGKTAEIEPRGGKIGRDARVRAFRREKRSFSPA